MADLEFDVSTEWTGDMRTGRGHIHTGAQRVDYAGPVSMGGSGTGSNPEELLLSAVVSCYTIGLSNILHKRGLRFHSISVHAKGTVSNYPRAATFSRIVVSPTVAGADTTRVVEYEAAAAVARQRCFIGKTLSPSVIYEVGHVNMLPKPAVRPA